MSQKTKTEIIHETAEFYSKNPRSVSPSMGCCYLDDDGNKCAFSRCCTDEGVETLHSQYEGKSIEAESIGDANRFLKDEYKGHETNFWSSIQRFHDNATNFDANGGLSANGENMRDSLLSLYGEN